MPECDKSGNRMYPSRESPSLTDECAIVFASIRAEKKKIKQIQSRKYFDGTSDSAARSNVYSLVPRNVAQQAQKKFQKIEPDFWLVQASDSITGTL